MLRYTRNNIIKFTAFLTAIAALASCSSISVNSDWDPNIDFSKFNTFAVLDEPTQAINRLVDERIRTAITAELTARGLRQVDKPEKADLAIGYQVTTEERTTYQTVHGGWSASRHSFNSSHMRWGGSVGTSRTTPVNFTVGTLVIAVFQMNNKELVWEGSGSGTVNPSSGPEQSAQRINDAVQRILKDFPPGMKPKAQETY